LITLLRRSPRSAFLHDVTGHEETILVEDRGGGVRAFEIALDHQRGFHQQLAARIGFVRTVIAELRHVG
jgi:hypothetical protein